MKKVFTPSWLFFVVMALLAFFVNFFHELGRITSLAAVLILPGILVISYAGMIIFSNDYSENGPRHRFRLFYSSLKHKTIIFFDSIQARIYGRNYKRNLRKITAELHKSGAKSTEELKKKFRLPEEELNGYLSDLIWRKWAEAIPSLDKDRSTVYRITDRGSRDLANPGSTDHEEL